MERRKWSQTQPGSLERRSHFFEHNPTLVESWHESPEGKEEWNKRYGKEVAGFTYPEDFQEQVRRSRILAQDSILQDLRAKWKASISWEEEQVNYYNLQSRRWQFFMVEDPEGILNDPESFRPLQVNI